MSSGRCRNEVQRRPYWKERLVSACCQRYRVSVLYFGNEHRRTALGDLICGLLTTTYGIAKGPRGMVLPTQIGNLYEVAKLVGRPC